MPYLAIENFRAGLDTRRLYETSPAGTLLACTNAHISQGGEVEQRLAFVEHATLPANTHGLYGLKGELVTFGSDAPPSLPAGYRYVQLTIPAAEDMVAVHNVSVFAGLLYVVAEFNDGTIHHFYDGTRVVDWFDGRARAEFQIDSGSAGQYSAAVIERTRLTFYGVPKAGTGTMAGIAVSLTASDVTDLETAVAKIAADLAADPLTGSVEVGGAVITYTYAVAGAVAPADKFTDGYVGSTGLVLSSYVLDAGADEVNIPASKISTVTVDGIDVLVGAVEWDGDVYGTALAVAEQINNRVTSPDYEATAIDNRVIVAAAENGTAANGRTLAVTTADGASVTINSATFAGGATLADTYDPGKIVMPAKSKMYSVSNSLVHFSELNNPAEWNPPATGAGFIDMTSQAPEGGELKTLAPYFDYHAVFSENNIQIWEFDVDELLNTQRQVLNNTGTIAPKSVASFGSNDVFYLSYTGIRSLRARDTTTSAAVTDVGTAIDELITTQVIDNATDAYRAIAVVNPMDGRYWLAIGSTIYVFSYFPGSKVSAWSTYEPGFVPEHFTTLNGRVAVRSGDKVYKYGGDDGKTYDASETVAWLPYLDMSKAAHVKTVLALDAAMQGAWEVYISTDHTRPDAFDLVGFVDGTTYTLQTIAAQGVGTHISLKFVKSEASRGRIGNVAIHYNAGEAL